MYKKKLYRISSIILLLLGNCFLLQSCLWYVFETKIERKANSIIRYDGKNDKSRGIIRTDGLYIYENLIKDPKGGLNFLGFIEPREEHVHSILGLKFFDDGTVFYTVLIGNEYDVVKPYLDGFEIYAIWVNAFGMYSIAKDSILLESYVQRDYITPYEVNKKTLYIENDTTIYRYFNHRYHKLIFVPCDIPITPHHPFKSKRWLWTDKKARKQYMREWKEVKKERKKSKIKYYYE